MTFKKSTRPKPKKWLPREHPRYVDEIWQVDVPLRRTLGATLFIRAKSKGEKEGILQLWDRFLARAAPELQWWHDSNVERLRPFDDRYRDFPKRVLGAPIKDFTYWDAHSGERARDAAELRFVAALHASAKAGDPLDSAYWTMKESVDPRVLLDEALGLARIVPIRHGTVGYCLDLCASDRRHEHYSSMWAACARFRGLDFPDRVSRSDCLDGIPTTNWITFVHESFLEKVGGPQKLRKQLGQNIVFHEVLEGLAIQAGPQPLLGDVNAGEDLPLYQEVARALAPIRSGTAFRGRWRLHFGGPNEQRNNFNTEETAAWLARFER